jgi:hypothetical protein
MFLSGATYVCKNHFSLAIFDSLYLVYYVVDYGIIGTFMRANEEKSEPYWYRVTYPFLLWPLKWMFMSCTIFMVINSHHLHFILHTVFPEIKSGDIRFYDLFKWEN